MMLKNLWTKLNQDPFKGLQEENEFLKKAKKEFIACGRDESKMNPATVTRVRESSDRCMTVFTYMMVGVMVLSALAVGLLVFGMIMLLIA